MVDSPQRQLDDCPGCGAKGCGGNDQDVILTMVDRGRGQDWHLAFCTPRCAYDWWRKMLDEDYAIHVEPDLLVVTAHDLWDAFDIAMTDEATGDQLAEVTDAWFRLGHVLGQVDPRPPELIQAELAKREEQREAAEEEVAKLVERFRRAMRVMLDDD